MTGRGTEPVRALRRDVEHLAGKIGERHVGRPAALRATVDWLIAELDATGLAVSRQGFEVSGVPCWNVEAELPGTSRPGEVVVVGAHHDTVPACPGANDNGTGVAALLALARASGTWRPERTVRFVSFANEEPPHFMTADMGSWHHARACREAGEDVVAMLSLETIGYYSDDPGSQAWPPLFGVGRPTVGNFVLFVGNLSSLFLARRASAAFRETVDFPCEWGAAPEIVPGVAWSDQWSYWRHGFPALMVTDTAPYRYPHYHEPTDTPDRIRFDALERVVRGLDGVVQRLATG